MAAASTRRRQKSNRIQEPLPERSAAPGTAKVSQAEQARDEREALAALRLAKTLGDLSRSGRLAYIRLFESLQEIVQGYFGEQARACFSAETWCMFPIVLHAGHLKRFARARLCGPLGCRR
jgi:hypothetical protein